MYSTALSSSCCKSVPSAVRALSSVSPPPNFASPMASSRCGSKTPTHQLPPLLIAGPSGVGKGTLNSRLLSEYGHVVGKSVSHTTRAPRAGEVHGVSYWFTDKPSFQNEIAEGKFLEHAVVHGNIYGTSWAGVRAVQDAGKICLLEIDVEGVKNVKASELGRDARCIFILPPSMEELERRLRGRGTEDEEKVRVRLETTRREMEDIKKMDIDYYLVNNDVDEAFADLVSKIRLWYPEAFAQGESQIEGSS